MEEGEKYRKNENGAHLNHMFIVGGAGRNLEFLGERFEIDKRW